MGRSVGDVSGKFVLGGWAQLFNSNTRVLPKPVHPLRRPLFFFRTCTRNSATSFSQQSATATQQRRHAHVVAMVIQQTSRSD